MGTVQTVPCPSCQHPIAAVGLKSFAKGCGAVRARYIGGILAGQRTSKEIICVTLYLFAMFFEEPARSLQKIISELFISISAIVIIDWDVYNNIDIIVLVNNLGGANMSDINALLEKAINETAKLCDGEDFLLRDLFKGYEWNRISRSNRLLLGTLFLNKINSENLDISASAKTSSGQQKYQIVRRK